MRPTFALILLALVACKADSDATSGDKLPTSGTFSDCDPVAPTRCGLPFPSTFYMQEDATTPTGWRIALGATSLPANIDGYQASPDILNERDGWSVATPIMAHLQGMTLQGVAGHDDIGASLADGSATILVDVDTGERVAHWGELDMSHDEDDRRMLIIHPAAPLPYGHRFVVGLRFLVDATGAAIVPSEAFEALRDDTSTDDWDVEGRRDVYDEVVFPALEAQGWSRGDVQLAWDFVTGSQDGITGKAVWMRDDALSRLADGPSYTIDQVEENPREHTAFRLYGHMTVPNYMTADEPGTLLTRGDDGMPFYNGDTSVPFTVVVPTSLVEEGRPGPIVQYGHGLLGAQDEVETGYLAEMSDRYGWILIAVDWKGMSEDDRNAIMLMLVEEIDQFAMIPERSEQGFVEFLAAMRLATGPLVDDPNLQVQDPESGEMVSLIDPTHRYFYGNSQGAILGGAYVALSQDIDRAVLGVGGAPYALLLYRSQDFEPFFIIFRTMWPDPLDIALWLGAMQTMWDSGEAAGYALSVNQEPLPDTPPKDILMQVAIGDHQVNTLGAHVMSRAYGSSLVGTPVRDVWGLTTQDSGFSGSALVEWDYGIEEPAENIPPDSETDPHEGPRREPAGQDQINTFLTTGEVIDTCQGPCTGTQGR